MALSLIDSRAEIKFSGGDERQEKINLNYILGRYLRGREEVKDSYGEVKEYYYSTVFFPFQKSYQQKKEAVEALKSALRGEPVDLTPHLPSLRNGELGQKLRNFIKSGRGNILVNQEVNTVRDFVQALQVKNANAQLTC